MSRFQRILGYVAVVLTCVLLVIGMLLALARSARVQTALLGVVTTELSRGLEADVRVGSMHYAFPSSLLIRDVLLSDQQQDTLLAVDTLSARFDLRALFVEDRVMIRTITLSGATIDCHQSADSVWNYQFLADILMRPKQPKQPKVHIPVEIDAITLQRVNLRYGDVTVSDLSANLSLDEWQRIPHAVRAHFVLNHLTCVAEARGYQLRFRDLSTEIRLAPDTIRMPAFRLAADVLNQGRSSSVDLEANIDGRLDSLCLSDLTFAFNGERLLLGDVSVLGWPNRDSLHLRAECRDLFVNKGILQDMVSSLRGRPYTLPPLVARLGNMHYRGVLQGRMDSLTLRGAFTSSLGTLVTNGSAQLSPDMSEIAFQGRLSSQRFRLGKLLQRSDLGRVSLDVQLDGRKGETSPLVGDVQGRISLLEYRDYAYQDLSLSGRYDASHLDATLCSQDPNLDALLRLQLTLPAHHQPAAAVCSASLRSFRPGALHLSEKLADADLSLRLKADLRASSLDDLTGMLRIDSCRFYHNDYTIPLEEFLLTIQPGQLKVASDYLSLAMSGAYSYTTLVASLQKVLVRVLPHAFSDDYRNRILAVATANQVEADLYLRGLAPLCRCMGWPVIDSYPTCKLYLSDAEQQLNFRAVVPEINKASSAPLLRDLSVALHTDVDAPLSLAVTAAMPHRNNAASRKLGDLNLSFSAEALNDTLAANFRFRGADAPRYGGEVLAVAACSQYASRPVYDLHLLPSTLVVADSLWYMDGAHMLYTAADRLLAVDAFLLTTGYQTMQLHGLASASPADTLFASLDHIDLDYLLGSFTDVHNALSFGGTVTGWARAYSVLSKPLFEASVEMLHGRINGCEIGDIRATAHLDSLRQVVIDGHVQEQEREVCRVDGLVVPPQWELDIYPDSVQIGFVNYWVKGILADLQGRASGHVHVGGNRVDGKPLTYVTLEAVPHSASFVIPYTGARYVLDRDTIRMDSTAILFTDIHATDVEGHPLDVNGAVRHDGQWRDLTYDLSVHARRAICLDLPVTPANFYAGKVYGTGDVTIRGDVKLCTINASARTEAGSEAVITVSGPSTAGESDFVRFINPTAPAPHRIEPQLNVSSSTGLQMQLDIEATPACLARVVIDPRTNDELRGHGEGNVRIQYGPAGFEMYGGYTLRDGTFTFTIQNVIRREFDLAAGSSVTWTGDPEEPTIDGRALYHVTASLRDLLGADMGNVSTTRSSIPVNCVLSLSDRLMDPTIRFGLEFPSSDETVASQARAAISSEDMLMRQVLYLLVFGRFYTPEYLQNTSNMGVNETYSLLSSTITGQINNWLGRITDAFTLGFNMRTDGEGADASQEYEAQFEIRPVAGLMINGNFGYRYNDIANQPVFGNLDVEYALTKDGNLRAKAFTHTVDRYSLRTATTVQGVGLKYQYDFNTRPRQRRSRKSTNK